jgi:hypothetical protein
MFVFLALTALTLVSWFLAEGTLAAPLAATIVVLIGSIKIRLVFINFMELKNNVQPWRFLFELWLGLVTISVLLGYWYPLMTNQ